MLNPQMKSHLSCCARRVFLCLLILTSVSTNAQDYSVPNLSFLTGPRYGRSCGWSGEDPPERIRTETLIRFKDKTGILNMLFDEEPALQAYGAEAVMRLQRHGVTFSKQTLEKVEAVKKSKQEILVCSGCTTMTLPTHIALSGAMEASER